jgi:hypothetical protein
MKYPRILETATMATSETSLDKIVITAPFGAKQDAAYRTSARGIIRHIEHAEAVTPIAQGRRIAAR